MRVIAGEFGGRRLRAPAGAGTRPTSDLVRGAFFDALEARRASEGALRGLVALDLYAGSGAVGIEALSRGCAQAWFVEAEPGALAVCRANLRALGAAERARLLGRPVERVLAGPALGGGRFDLVFADPPYALGVAGVLAALGAGPEWLGAGALCALEHADREELPERSGTLLRVWRRTYGATAVSIYAADPAGGGRGGATRGRGNTGAGSPLSR